MNNLIGSGMENQENFNVKINLEDLKQISCKECGGILFEEGLQLFRLSALLSPTGKESIVPKNVLLCSKCKMEIDTEEFSGE